MYLTRSSVLAFYFFFFSSRRRHTRFDCDWSSDVCSSDLLTCAQPGIQLRDSVSDRRPLVRDGGMAAQQRSWQTLSRRAHDEARQPNEECRGKDPVSHRVLMP